MTNLQQSRTRWRIAFAVVVLFAAVAWLVAFPAYKRHRAIQEIERVGGMVYRVTVGPQWLRKWGIVFDRINDVYLKSTEITDDGLQYLSSLSSFRVLYLDDTEISDEELKHLRSLTNLEGLSLADTHITDHGLQHLRGLTNLKFLDLNNTEVTEDGIEMLQESLPNCQIEWSLPNE
jgi:hypothetical protein